MEFNYSDYLVRITLNPVDIIVRFEHNTNFRSYEQTFFDRDFPEASFLGGLEFVGKALSTAFSIKPGDVSIEGFKKTTASLSFQVVISNPLFVSPMCLSFDLPAVRKESGNLDVNVLNRKVKEMSEALEKRLTVLDTLTLRLKEVEERCGSSITLPGCIFAIPINLTSLILVRNQTVLPDGRAFTTMMPGHHTSGQYNNNPVNFTNMLMGHNHLGYTVSWNPAQEAFAFDKLTSLSNLKYLKHCKQLTLSGCMEVADYSVLGEMPWITHLTIVSSRQWAQHNTSNGNQWSWVNAGNNPTITNISWIKNIKNLQSLTLLGCSSLSDITPLKDLPNLRELDIRETGVRNTDFLINPNLKITK